MKAIDKELTLTHALLENIGMNPKKVNVEPQKITLQYEIDADVELQSRVEDYLITEPHYESSRGLEYGRLFDYDGYEIDVLVVLS
jgi:hypothetical protein